ncbi:hypothetical protein M422DRAFT_63551, partial [Sphaerobolus stellatus SS14]
MDGDLSGFEKWIAGVRRRLANDAGRRDLQDHIHCKGFLFLDEYLEDILFGAKSELPLRIYAYFALITTPGRRQDYSKRRRAAANVTSPLKDPFVDKSSYAATEQDSFEQALFNMDLDFQALDDKAPVQNIEEPEPTIAVLDNRSSHSSSNVKEASPLIEPQGDVIEVTVASSAASFSLNAEDIRVSASVSPTENVAHEPNSEISPVKPTLRLIERLSAVDELDNENPLCIASGSTGLITSANVNSSSIPADPSSLDGPMATFTNIPWVEDDCSFFDSEPSSRSGSLPLDPYARDYETLELPAIVPIPAQSTTRAHPLDPLPATSPLTRKTSVPVHPTLPSPSPPRKSSREGSGLPSEQVTQAGEVKRTSWLTKRRDTTARRTLSSPQRKSSELYLDDESMFNPQHDERPRKALSEPRMEDGILEAPENKSKGKEPVRPTILPFIPINRSREAPQDYDDLENSMEVFERTEANDLGMRTERSSGKSSISAAAAEAKAAAEARIAQREAKVSSGKSVTALIQSFESGQVGRLSTSGSRNSLSRPSLGGQQPRFSSLSRSHRSSSITAPSSACGRAVVPKFQVQRDIHKELFSRLSQQLSQFPPSQEFQPGPSQPTQTMHLPSIIDDNADDHTAEQSSYETAHSQPYIQPALEPEVTAPEGSTVNGPAYVLVEPPEENCQPPTPIALAQAIDPELLQTDYAGPAAETNDRTITGIYDFDNIAFAQVEDGDDELNNETPRAKLPYTS